MAAKTQMHFSSFPFYVVLLFTISLNLLLTSATIPPRSSSSFDFSSMRIVYTERPSNQKVEAYHIQILTSVLGSQEAARKALVYSFKSSICGFAAKLTPEQFNNISKQPGVLSVAQSVSYDLQSKIGMNV